jgi:hypothetical protein
MRSVAPQLGDSILLFPLTDELIRQGTLFYIHPNRAANITIFDILSLRHPLFAVC